MLKTTSAGRPCRAGVVVLSLATAVAVGPLLVSSSSHGATTGLAPFASHVSKVNAAQLGRSWRPGCPVAPTQLRLVRLRYVGFDQRAHDGLMIVNVRVVPSVIRIFATLYGKRFPIHSMAPASSYGGSDPMSMAADNTSGFNCRYAVAPGPPRWSVHAFGEAIDVNPVQNPYLIGRVTEPTAGTGFENRAVVRPGMAVRDGVLVSAFTSVGWYWGGRWSATPDYQHFSSTGG